MTSREPARIRTSHGLKATREALCVAQAWLGGVHDNGEAARAITTIQHLIDDIDRQRPLGPDGMHGDRHTPTCGCEDVDVFALHASTQEEPLQVTCYRPPQAGDSFTVTDVDDSPLYGGRWIVDPDSQLTLSPRESEDRS